MVAHGRGGAVEEEALAVGDAEVDERPGLGPEATSSFSGGGLSGRNVSTWQGRDGR